MDNSQRILDKLEKVEDRIEKKLDKLDHRVDYIEKELAVYNEQLKQHIEGVKQLKIENELLREYMDLEVKKLETSLVPVKMHVKKITALTYSISYIFTLVLKLAGAIGIIAGAIYGTQKLP